MAEGNGIRRRAPLGDQVDAFYEEIKTNDQLDCAELPLLYSIHKSRVSSTKEYGAFVELPGYRKSGLIHVSQLSDCRIETTEDVVHVGEEVWVKVISLGDEGNRKVSLSLKSVNQTTGKDMDPGHSQCGRSGNSSGKYRKGERGTGGDGKGISPIELEALYNITCPLCGCEDEVMEAQNVFNNASAAQLLSQAKAERKERKRIRKQKRQRSREEHAERKKQKKRYRDDSYSDSDSSSSSSSSSSIKRHKRHKKKSKRKHDH